MGGLARHALVVLGDRDHVPQVRGVEDQRNLDLSRADLGKRFIHILCIADIRLEGELLLGDPEDLLQDQGVEDVHVEHLPLRGEVEAHELLVRLLVAQREKIVAVGVHDIGAELVLAGIHGSKVSQPAPAYLGLFPVPERVLLHVEVLQDGRPQLVDALHLDVVKHPVGGEDGEAFVLGVHQEHHDELPRRVGPRLRVAAAHLVADGEHGLVAVVAVGDVDLQAVDRARDDLALRGIREAPQLVPHAHGLLGIIDDRLFLLLPVEDVVDHVRLVLVEAPDVLELGVGDLGEPDAVFQRALEDLLVGEDLALGVVAQAHRADEPLHLLAPDLEEVELLLVDPE